MKELSCTLELLQRSRRQPLSHAEALHLERHLAGCPSCRLDRRLFEAFDPERRVQPGDDALDEAVVERVIAARRGGVRPTRPRGRRLAWAAAFAACLVVTLAAARELWWVARATSAPIAASGRTPASAPARPAGPPNAHAQALDGLAEWSAPSAPSNAGPLAPVAPPPRAPVARATHPVGRGTAAAAGPLPGNAGATAPPAEASERDSAAALFERANRARRDMRRGEAIALYEALQRLHPRTREALVSRVSSGRLLLDNGRAEEALSQFTAYLAAADADGTLRPEALVGQARALDALGRSRAAREVWLDVANAYPGSVYADEARQRSIAPP